MVPEIPGLAIVKRKTANVKGPFHFEARVYLQSAILARLSVAKAGAIGAKRETANVKCRSNAGLATF
jgi:hypothetical protein